MTNVPADRRIRSVAPVLGVLSLALVACRADVDGVWEGSIGGQSARLSLQQAGSVIGGEVCIAQGCAEVEDGELVEGDLLLEYGCLGCDLEPALLDATVEGASMVGVAYLEPCDCRPEGCNCALEVDLERAE